MKSVGQRTETSRTGRGALSHRSVRSVNWVRSSVVLCRRCPVTGQVFRGLPRRRMPARASRSNGSGTGFGRSATASFRVDLGRGRESILAAISQSTPAFCRTFSTALSRFSWSRAMGKTNGLHWVIVTLIRGGRGCSTARGQRDGRNARGLRAGKRGGIFSNAPRPVELIGRRRDGSAHSAPRTFRSGR